MNNSITETIHEHLVFKRRMHAGNRTNPWIVFFSSPSHETCLGVVADWQDQEGEFYEYKIVDERQADGQGGVWGE